MADCHPSTMALPQVPAIYLLTNLVNGKRYIGQARNLRKRWYWHRNAACGAPDSSYQQKTAIARAMRKYGVANFSLTIIEHCAQASLDGRESHWIAYLNTMVPAGYNLTAGGSHGLRSPDVGAKISAANRGRIKTTEWRAKLSMAHAGKKLSPEHRRKISEVQKGRKQSPESNAKRSLKLKGVKRGPYSLERCAAIAAGMTPEGRLRTLAASLAPDVVARRAATNRRRHAEMSTANGI